LSLFIGALKTRPF